MCANAKKQLKSHMGGYLNKWVIFALILSLLLQICPLHAHALEDEPIPQSIPLEGYLLTSVTPTLPQALRGTSAQAAILMNADSGEVLFRQNENACLPMASTTKIMTALVAAEAMAPKTPVKITSDAVGVEGSSVYLTEGEVLTLEDLLYCLMLSSANDAAVAIAIAVSGSVEAFSERMNEKAIALGLKDTHFTNPHGLDDPEHYTTAYELAVIARAAMSHELLKTIMATPKKTVPHMGTDGVRLLVNHNKLLRSYEGAIGVKTGFTKKSGRCLVSAAEQNGITLIAVTLNDGDDWRDHTTMLDYGFSLYETIELCPIGAFEAPLWVIGGNQEYVMVKNTQAASVSLPKNRGAIRCAVELPTFIYAPVAQGQAVGRLAFYEILPDGTHRLIHWVPLYAQHEVESVTYPKSLLEKISELFG